MPGGGTGSGLDGGLDGAATGPHLSSRLGRRCMVRMSCCYFVGSASLAGSLADGECAEGSWLAGIR